MVVPIWGIMAVIAGPVDNSMLRRGEPGSGKPRSVCVVWEMFGTSCAVFSRPFVSTQPGHRLAASTNNERCFDSAAHGPELVDAEVECRRLTEIFVAENPQSNQQRNHTLANSCEAARAVKQRAKRLAVHRQVYGPIDTLADPSSHSYSHSCLFRYFYHVRTVDRLQVVIARTQANSWQGLQPE